MGGRTADQGADICVNKGDQGVPNVFPSECSNVFLSNVCVLGY
jgi:hypothetical protein